MVEILDENFKKFIERLFNKPINNITQDDYNSINEIECICYNIKNLEGIENFTNLEILNCYANDLNKLDISKNIRLKKLNCQCNLLIELDISKNINLEYLDCELNKIKKLNVSKNDKLKIKHCYYDKNTEVIK